VTRTLAELITGRTGAQQSLEAARKREADTHAKVVALGVCVQLGDPRQDDLAKARTDLEAARRDSELAEAVLAEIEREIGTAELAERAAANVTTIREKLLPNAVAAEVARHKLHDACLAVGRALREFASAHRAASNAWPYSMDRSEALTRGTPSARLNVLLNARIAGKDVGDADLARMAAGLGG
jgi:hypothetical protein